MAAVDAHCTVLVAPNDKGEVPTREMLQRELESTDENRKIMALKQLVELQLSGESMPGLLMPVIRFCSTVENHELKKVLMLYWETVRKHDASGALLPELIMGWSGAPVGLRRRAGLGCVWVFVVWDVSFVIGSNALRNNLMHPNEYVQGSTLRFLCKLKHRDLFEPLVPAIKQCLVHRHPYVRRNAVLAVYHIVQQFGQELMPEAADEIEKFIEEESDRAARRNAFLMLFNTAQERALAFFNRHKDDLESFGEGFQLVLLELARRLCRQDPSMKVHFIRPIFQMLRAPSSAVVFDAASALTSMSSAPTAVRAAAQAYASLLSKESDNNVKLVVLERLAALRVRHAKVLRELVMDILRSLTTPDIDIRRRVLDITLDLLSVRNVEEVIGFLRKEVLSTQGETGGGGGGDGAGRGSSGRNRDVAEYRRLLISAIHQCAARFPDSAHTVVLLLMDFLGGVGSANTAVSVDGASAVRVAHFMREMCDTHPKMRPAALEKLCEVMPEIRSSEVARVALWVLGQYSQTEEEVARALGAIRECLGSLPLTQPHTPPQDSLDGTEWQNGTPRSDGGASETPTDKPSKGTRGKSSSTGPKVLPDGTYASQSAFSEGGAGGDDADASDSGVRENGRRAGADEPSLRRLLLRGRGDFFLGSVLSTALTKLALRAEKAHGAESRFAKATIVDSLFVMCALLEVGQTELSSNAGPEASVRGRGNQTTGGDGEDDPDVGVTPGESGSLAVANGSDDRSAALTMRMDQDAFEHTATCVRILGEPELHGAAGELLLEECESSFRDLLQATKRFRVGSKVMSAGGAAGSVAGSLPSGGPAGGSLRLGAANTEGSGGATTVAKPIIMAQADDCILLRQLRGRGGATSAEDLALDEESQLREVTGSPKDDFGARLRRVRQLTGFADPVYAEACMTVHDYDILLEIAVINRTEKTLTNAAVELATKGELKLVDRPGTFTLGPGDSHTVQAAVKVSSTETGYIYGNVVFDSPSRAAEKVFVNLADIHVDIMDYIHPADCEPAAFRRMWADFEWENKIAVNTNITDLEEFVQHILSITNMKCLTPTDVLASEAQLVAANLCARSTFGEDALANLSVESKQDGSIRGHVRIRSKTQGMALALGDRITGHQKK